MKIWTNNTDTTLSCKSSICQIEKKSGDTRRGQTEQMEHTRDITNCSEERRKCERGFQLVTVLVSGVKVFRKRNQLSSALN